MNSNLENFKPKLRPGRVIPQGARIIFETENPYNQIILPMAMADLILLCSGQFSVRNIVEKIYKKQGVVPFRTLLKSIHVLHTGGFFENGHELELNPYLRSWMEPRQGSWNYSWRFGQRILAERKSPTAFYVLTLILLVTSIFGFQLFPLAPLEQLETWASSEPWYLILSSLILGSSLLQTVRYFMRGAQLLLLTGKAYNVSFRLSFWGLHLHVGDETNDLFENRLYTAMFHVSQIFLGWGFLFALAPVLNRHMLEPLILVNILMTIWETNPFVASEGRKLVQALLLPNDRDIASWHFESSILIKAIAGQDSRGTEDFARVCSIWGSIWLFANFLALHETAIVFGPSILSKLMRFNEDSILPAMGLGLWLTSLFYVVQSLVETLIASLLRPWLKALSARLQSLRQWKTISVEQDVLIRKIENLPLFSHFQEAALKRIIENSKVLEHPRKAHIIRQGEPSAHLFVLLEGQVEIIKRSGLDEEWLIELSSVSIFGEAALLSDSPRGANVIAKTRSLVMKVPVSFVRQFAEETHVIREVDAFRNAILVNQFFSSSPIFRSLSPDSVEFLNNRGSLEYYDEQQTVFQQGDPGDSIYLVLRGSVEVEVHGTTVKTVSQGSFFGEIALIANIPRTGTIRALEPSVFFKVSSDSFWEVLVQHLDLGVFIETISENRLREDLEIVSVFKATGSDS